MSLSRKDRDWWAEMIEDWRVSRSREFLPEAICDPVIAVADHLVACEALLRDILAVEFVSQDGKHFPRHDWELIEMRIAALLGGAS